MATAVKIIDTASAKLRAIADCLTRRKPLNAALGKRGEVVLRDHFAERESEPNAKGWPKQHFWSRIRQATAFAGADEDGATVIINDPALAQKVYGGTITPKEGKYLAIPAIAAAAGRSPRSFANVHVMVRTIGGVRKAVALVENVSTPISFGRPRKDGSRKMTRGETQGGEVAYWLVEKVTQSADPRALPLDREVSDALLDEAQRFIERVTGK